MEEVNRRTYGSSSNFCAIDMKHEEQVALCGSSKSQYDLGTNQPRPLPPAYVSVRHARL